MFENLELLRMSHALAVHSGARQAVIARNVAQADTPGYLRQDLPSFVRLYERGRDLRVPEAHVDATSDSPNGNGVSVEHEMMLTAQIRQQHDMALSIYRSSLTMLRTSLGRRG